MFDRHIHRHSPFPSSIQVIHTGPKMSDLLELRRDAEKKAREDLVAAMTFPKDNVFHSNAMVFRDPQAAATKVVVSLTLNGREINIDLPIDDVELQAKLSGPKNLAQVVGARIAGLLAQEILPHTLHAILVTEMNRGNKP